MSARIFRPNLWFQFQLFIALGLASCSTLISDEFPDYDPEPALSSIVIAGQPLEAHLSFAEKIDSTPLLGNGDAAVYYRSGDNAAITMTGNDSGLYYTDYIPGPGEIVELTAIMPGFADVSATDTIPSTVQVAITDYTNRARYTEDGYLMEGLTIRFSDDPEKEDYYELLISREKDDLTYYQYAFNDRLDILLNEGIDPYSTKSLLFSDVLFKDEIVEMSVDFRSNRISSTTRCHGVDSCYHIYEADTLTAELRHVSESYYRYKKQFFLYEKNREVSFVEGTAISISNFSNVTNGRGIVASYAWSTDSLIVPVDSILLSYKFP